MTDTSRRLSSLLSITCMLALGAAVLGCALPAGADDLNPPWWRGLPNTTTQQWLFNAPVQGSPPLGPADGFVHNPYGQPTLEPNTVWFDAALGREGLYGLPGAPNALHFNIPNRPEPNDRKLIRLQMTWYIVSSTRFFFAADTEPASTLANQSSTVLADGWRHGTWDLIIPYNPPGETLLLTGEGILVDQVIIDTWCVPEPGSFAALTGGLLGMAAVLRRRC